MLRRITATLDTLTLCWYAFEYTMMSEIRMPFALLVDLSLTLETWNEEFGIKHFLEGGRVAFYGHLCWYNGGLD